MQTQTEGAGPSRIHDKLPSNGTETSKQYEQRPRPSNKVLQWYSELVESQTTAIVRHREGMDYKDIQVLHDTSTWLDWTPRDQSGFFAALSRHSRLRADLVAYDCGKPESEVLIYLDSLDRGLAKVVQADQSDQDGRRRRGRREGKAKSAREMTESWIQEEESLAAHLIQAGREVERIEEETQTLKRRKIERSAMKASVRSEAADKAERHDLSRQGGAELQSRWAREDWGRAIGWEKLGQLNRLTRPSWAEWYADRLRQPTEKPKVSTPLDPSSPPPSPGPTRSYNKHTKIAIDNAKMQALLTIDKRSRSPHQRAELTKLLNRKRNREHTRLQKLLQIGKTEEEIKAEGGVDKAFLISIGKDVDAETPTDIPTESPVIAKAETPQPSKRTRFQSLSRQGTPLDVSTVSEDDPALQDLRDMGLDTYLAAENLDVINFAALASQYSGPDVPLQMLRDILVDVKDYLRQITMQAILLAEARALQYPDDDQPAEIETKHVEFAIAAIDDEYRGAVRISHHPHDAEALKEDHYDNIDDDEPGLTDQEDNQLDQAATDLDEKLDSAAELALWQAAEELSLPHLKPDDIIQSRKSYRKLLDTVGHARRHRHSIQRRSILFPSTGYRRPSTLRAGKIVKSAAIVESSDDEMGDLDPQLEYDASHASENEID